MHELYAQDEGDLLVVSSSLTNSEHTAICLDRDGVRKLVGFMRAWLLRK